ncbi:MAG: hypothetical protein HKN77_03085 [Woeseiaceae bacterium]|nr:hypothetical protein [Woeseiaceae bacterium]
MNKEDEDSETGGPRTLEHLDAKESFRQLWWSIGVTLIALAVLAYFYF